jgi:two-component system CheB/CheR fusion protein
VEDDPDTAWSLEVLLGLLGHETRVARSGPEAVRAAAEFSPVVVLCDIGLPGFDGFEVARRVRALPGVGPALLVAVTGHAGEDDRRECLAAGFHHHLAKPADPSAILALLAARAG